MHYAAYEFPRIPLLRTPVNKGEKSMGGGSGEANPPPFLFLAVQSPTRLALPRGSKLVVTNLLGWVWTNVNSLPSGAMN
jgi:hypothetical protein